MTVEAGAVTGGLELATRPLPEGLGVKVRYAGAEEWYTVEGSPIPRANTGKPDLHERVVECLRRPGPVVGGNELPASLRRFRALEENRGAERSELT